MSILPLVFSGQETSTTEVIVKVLCVFRIVLIPSCSLQFTIEDISSATKDRVIGCGGFGIVYKGLFNGSYVAIKKLMILYTET